MRPRFFRSPAEFRSWLEKNHARAKEVLVGFWKVSTGKPSLTWSPAVDEALCFGWIDGKGKSLGAESFTIRFTPRRPGSNWSLVNIRKVKALVRAKRMTPAGLHAYETRTKKGDYSYEQRYQVKFSREQRAKLAANAKARAWFDAKPPGYRATATYWVLSAKREGTRESRLATLIACSARGRPIPMLERR